ncbi:flagellar FliJ family protein [Comamonas sp.]
MSRLRESGLGRYVDVLKVRAEQAHTDAIKAELALQQTRKQMDRLQQMAQTSALKNSAANVALYANAAGFRSGLMEMAQQFKDAYGVQQLQMQQAKQHMQQAQLRHESMQCVLDKALSSAALVQSRKAQKVMDEMAGQAWMRQRQAARVETGSR